MKNLKKVLMTVLMLVVFLVPATGCGEKNYGGIVESYEFVEYTGNDFNEEMLDLNIKFYNSTNLSKTYYFCFINNKDFADFECDKTDLQSLITNTQFVETKKNSSKTNYSFSYFKINDDYTFKHYLFNKNEVSDEKNIYHVQYILIFDNVAILDEKTDLLNYIGYIRF